MFQRYKKLDFAVLSQSTHSEGGDWRSIYFWAKHLESSGKRIALVKPESKRGLRQSIAIACATPKIIVNGLSTLSSWRVLLICLLRKDAAIYLHETAYVLDGFQKEHPLWYRLFQRIAKNNPLLCVSKQAEKLYRERFGAKKTQVVYECPGESSTAVSIDSTKTNIIMVGSINERKGAELFSKVADLAKARHPDWAFHWVGTLATMNALYRSEQVSWHGWHWNPASLLVDCELFFLSSIDDPCPLAALEAMHQGLRMVAYKDTGTAEIIHGLKGCAIFDDYSEQSALAAIEAALDAPSVSADIKAIAASTSSLDAFSERVHSAFTR